MKKILDSKIRFVITIVFIFCIILASIIIYFFNSKKVKVQNSNSDQDFTYNNDGTVTLGSGMLANGFYDINTNKIINSGSLLEPSNGKIQGQVSFKQNISEKRNYLLIIMIDYKQHDFIVNNSVYNTFPFSLKGEDGLRINVEITNIKSDEHEFSYLIIPEPDITKLSIDNSNEWNKLLMTSNIYWWRLLLNDLNKNNLEYDKSYVKMDSQTNFGIQLTKSHESVTAMPSCTSMDDVELILSNINNYDMEYVLIAFLNWKQSPFTVNDMMKLIDIPSKSTIYFKLKIPNVKKDTPYQIIAIPKPFSNNLKSMTPPISTLRTVVLPK